MYWFFNCNNYRTEAIKALVYSAFKHNPHFLPICIWDEPRYSEPDVKNWLIERGVLVIPHKPILDLSRQFDTIKAYSDSLGWGINKLTVNGCWQKVDVPKICCDLGIKDRYVLLTDPDCLWMDTFELEVKPPILAAACEEEPRRHYISGGIYVWNMPRAINDYNNFLLFCMQNFERVGHGDNVGYLHYYGYENISHLSPDWNFKPYWQCRENGLFLSPKDRVEFQAAPRLIHFQGHAKPWMDFPQYYTKWYDESIVDQIENYNKIWWKYVSQAEKEPFKFENNKSAIEKYDESEIKSTPIDKICQLVPLI